MEKDKVITTATSLYAVYGIKGVCMSHIASELAISKRTLYQEFGNKEKLLEECLVNEMLKLSDAISNVQASAGSSLEALLFTCTDVSIFYSSFCPAFHRDLIRFPEASRIWNKFRESFRDQCISNLRAGVCEGDILPDNNHELVAAMLINQLNHVKVVNRITMIATIIRGICTAKGMEVVGKLTYDI